jgi:hypothetical protein
MRQAEIESQRQCHQAEIEIQRHQAEIQHELELPKLNATNGFVVPNSVGSRTHGTSDGT